MFCVYSISYTEVDEDFERGMKRKYDGDDETVSVDKLQETLVNTCINKLSKAMTNGSRRRRTLCHTVLINNMLKSLEHASKPLMVGPENRARITARRQSKDGSLLTTKLRNVDASLEHSVVSDQQKLLSLSGKRQLLVEQPWAESQQPELMSLPWEPHHQLELLPSSVDLGDNEVMSSPTATFCPLLAVDLVTPVYSMDTAGTDTLWSSSKPETLDCDFTQYSSELDFFEPLPLRKTSVLVGSSFTTSDVFGMCDYTVTASSSDLVHSPTLSVEC